MKNITACVVFIGMISFLMSCDSTETTQNEKLKEAATAIDLEQGEAAEAYITTIDENDSLAIGNSLYYSRPDGSSFEVEFVVNDSGRVVKMTQFYTTTSSGSIQTKLFYYQNGIKYATKEYFETGTGESAKFVERISYYSKNEQPVATKQRIAPYENELEYEPFGLSELFDCNDAQAFRALNQEEEFETNFKGFATDGTASYLLVGENKPDGYISALLVKSYTPLINKLMSKEGIMRGVPIEVDFEKVRTTTGTYQMLLGVRQVNR